jgi:hypothetical protein
MGAIQAQRARDLPMNRRPFVAANWRLPLMSEKANGVESKQLTILALNSGIAAIASPLRIMPPSD